MIESFPNFTAANQWMSEHPEQRPVSIMPGINSGVVLVLFEAKDVSFNTLSVDCLTSEAMDSMAGKFASKRRGRPPKVKDA